MAFPKSVLPLAPTYIQSGTYTAQDDRREWGDVMSPGIVSAGDYAVTLTTLLGISIAPGVAYIPGLNVVDQGAYRQRMVSAAALTDDPANATNPRLDQVILRVMDSTADTSGLQEGRIEIATGTATAGATLDNRTGAADLTALAENSKSVVLLADLLVPAAATSFTGANLRDRRIPSVLGLGRGGMYRQFVTGLAAQGTIAPVQLFNFNIDKALMVEGRWIHMVATWALSNSSGAAVTTTYTFSGTGSSSFSDVTASIPSTAGGVRRACSFEAWIQISATVTFGIGRITMAAVGSSGGDGDIGGVPIADGVFLVQSINPTTVPVISTLNLTTIHSTANAAFNEDTPRAYLEIY